MHVSFVESGEIVLANTSSQPWRANAASLAAIFASPTPSAESIGRPSASNACAPIA
jgi:hypothetical protein